MVSTTIATPTETDNTNAAAAAGFIEALFQGTPGFIALSYATADVAAGRKPPLRTDWFATADAGAAAARAVELCAHRQHVWIGAGLQPEPLPPGTRGGSDNVCAVPGIWADVDISHPVHKKADSLPSDLDAALALVKTVRAAPTYIVHTGHGVQAWWLFNEPLTIQAPENRATAVGLLNRLKAQLCRAAADHGWKVDAVADLARLMRLPGTVNLKAEPAPVHVIEAAEFLRYDPADLDAELDPLPQTEQPAKPHSETK